MTLLAKAMRNSLGVILISSLLILSPIKDGAQAAEQPVDYLYVRGAVLHAPMPRLYGSLWQGDAWCAVNLVVDPQSGHVKNVYVTESAGDSSYMIYHVIETLRTWSFRPGTPKLIRVTFGLGNYAGRGRRR